MDRKLFFVLLVAVFMLVSANNAFANIFIDFESPEFAPDSLTGNNLHTYNTAYGVITFNGRIWNQLDSEAVNDITPPATGDGYFLKNVAENGGKIVTISFDFDVWDMDMYWYGDLGTNMHGRLYDINGPLEGDEGGDEPGTAEWEHVWTEGLTTPIRSIKFWTTNSQGALVGNKMAIDDLTLFTSPSVNATVPEPASMLLLGSGLVGMFFRRKFIG